MSNESGSFSKMSNQKSFDYLNKAYADAYNQIVLLLPSLTSKGMGRVLEIYAGLPFIPPTKTAQDKYENAVLHNLVKLGDIRTSILELVDEKGNVKNDEIETTQSDNSTASKSE